MDSDTADRLRELNADFYRRQCASFAETRQTPWPGWQKCLALLRENRNGNTSQELSVFDLASGNLRFEAFLASALPEAAFTFFAADNCDELLPSAPEAHYQHLDILAALDQNQSSPLSTRFAAPACDLSVCFGFLHHVPLPQQRAQILDVLIEQTKPGGYLIVSLWQFLNDPTRHKKAQATHTRAREELGLPELGDGDYLLGWKDIAHTYRYCHSFSDAEIDQLIASATDRTTLIARFTSDGRTGNLNTYLIFKVAQMS
ncbi:MAG: class I SAM-dependent methyltransferase [Coriobacteriia bacterium]|nr:class I SAM-dependent methyltransferase [Coriobacteriia bacterium]